MKRRIFTFLLLAILAVGGNAQQCITGNCSNFVSQWPAGTITPTTSWTTVSTTMNGGNWTLFNVTCGNTYDWTYCETYGGVSTAWDAQLTLYNYGNGTLLCFSDDNCGPSNRAPYIRWTADFTGTVRLLTSKYNCLSNGPSSPWNKLICRIYSVSSNSAVFTIKNYNGVVANNAKVKLWNSNYTQVIGIGYTNGSGQVSFSGLAIATYNYEIFYTPPSGTYTSPISNEEFWGSGSFSIPCSPGSTTPIFFTRLQPLISSPPSFSSNSFALGGSTNATFNIKNGLGYATPSYVAIYVDRDFVSPWDHSNSSAIQSIPANSTIPLSINNITPNHTGTYYYYAFVYSYVNSSYIITDQYYWTSAFNVICPFLATPTSPSPGSNSAPGTVLTIDNPTFNWSGNSSGIYHIQIWDAATNPTTNANVIYGFQIPSNSPGHCINGLSHTIPSGILVNNGQYKWSVHRNDPCGECESNNSTLLYFQVITCAVPTITAQPPPNSFVCNGQNITLSISATGTNISYQWQLYNGASWNNVGTNSSTYVTNVSGIYRCVVSGQCGTPQTSNNAVVSNGGSCQSPAAIFYATPTTLIAGQIVTLHDLSSNSPTSWYWDVQRVQANGATASFITSTNQNPSFAIVSPGCYKVVLTATNVHGSGTSGSTNCYIKVDANLNNNVPEYVSLDKKYPSGKGGDPVILSNGSFDISIKDLSVSGIKTNVSIERRYLSRNNEIGVFGKSWFFEFNTWIDFSTNPYEWQVHHGDGHISYHVPYQNGETKSSFQGMYDSLYYVNSGGIYTYTYVEKSGVKWNYRTDGKLESRVDLDGNVVACNYSGNTLASITAPGGRYINFTFNAQGRIITAISSGGKQADYYYSSDGTLLDSVKVGSSTTRFKYDTYGLTEVYDPNGNRVIKNVYNTNSQVIQQYDALNNLTTFSYNNPTTLQTTIINPLSKSRIVKHDNNYRLVESIDELNNKRQYSYNLDGLVETTTNELNNKREFHYDANKNLNKAIDEKNYFDTTGYGIYNRPVYFKDKEGNVLTINYNANGNPISFTQPNGGVVQTFYNVNGQDTLTVDAKGNNTRKEYYTNGDLYKITTPTSVTILTYDAQGRLTSIVNGRGYTTAIEYNHFDQVTKVTDPMGYFILFSYDLNGNLISYTDKEGNTTFREYDAKDRLTKIIGPNNHITVIFYDPLDRPIKIRDANGNVKLFNYDDAGRLTSLADSVLGILSSYTYDPVGNPITRTDGRGKLWRTAYDERNLPVAYTDPLNNQKTLVYNGNQQIIQLTDELNRNSYWNYNPSGLPFTVTDTYGNTVKHFYDLNNNLDNIVDAKGNIKRWTYDGSNRPKTYDEGFGLHKFSWDSVGNMSSYTDINNKITGFNYNPNNEAVGQTYQGAFLKNFTLSKNGWITEAANSTGTLKFNRNVYGWVTQKIGFYSDTLRYKYDSVGNVAELDYGWGKKLTYGYNSLYQSTSVKDWNNNTNSIFRDLNGNLDSLIYSNGSRIRVTRDDASRVKTWKSYLSANPSSLLSTDSLIRNAAGDIVDNPPIKILYPTIPEQSNNGHYTTADRITNYSTASYQSGSSGNITNTSSPQFTNSYNYENDGNTINGNLHDYSHNGTQQTNSFDAFNIRTAILNKSAFTIDNELAQRPLVLSEMNYGNGNTPRALNIYSPEGMLLGRDSSGTMSYPIPDVNGTIIALTNTVSTVTDKYASDPFGDYYTHIGGSTQPFSYLGMYGVQRDSSGLYYDWARYYDAHLGRFLSKDPYPANTLQTQGVNSYTYGFNNPTSFVDFNGLYSINIKRVITPYDVDVQNRGGYINSIGQTNDFIENLGGSLKFSAGSRWGSNGNLYLETVTGRVFNGNKTVTTSSLFTSSFKNTGVELSNVSRPLGNLINVIQLKNAFNNDGGSFGNNTKVEFAGIAGNRIGTASGQQIGTEIGVGIIGLLAAPEVATIAATIFISRLVGGVIGGYFGEKVGKSLIK